MRLDCAGAAGSGGQFGAGVDLPMKLQRGLLKVVVCMRTSTK